MEPTEENAVPGTDYFTKTEQFEPDTRDKPLAVTGDLAMKSNNTYRCGWKYTTEGGDSVVDAGSVKTIQNDPDAVEYFKGNYSGLQESYSSSGLKEYSQTH